MPGDPRLRASDADRERVASLLREHHADGRLTAEEFNDRLDAAFAARTLGDLDALLADLPGIDLYRLPAAGLRPAPGNVVPRAGGRLDHRQGGPPSRRTAGWRMWAAVTTVLVLIWLTSAVTTGGVVVIPWWLLIVVPWAVALARRARRGP